MRIRRIFALLAILLPLIGLAQKPRFAEKFSNDSTVFTLSVDPTQKIEAGKTFEARIKVNQTHWHMYSVQSSDEGPPPLELMIHPDHANKFTLVGVREKGKIVPKFDSEFMSLTKYLKDDFELIATIRVKKNVDIGKTPLALAIRYVTCSENICLPPRTFAIPMLWLGQKPLELTVAEATDSTADSSLTATGPAEDTILMPPPMATAPVGAPPDSTIAEASGEKDITTVPMAELIILSILGGLAALVTPCVFPMIPITVSFFTKRNQESRKDAIRDATLYAFGIIFTFVALGLMLSLVAGPAGIRNFASNPWTNMVVAAIFIAFALNLFGMFEIGLPSSVVSKLNMQAMQHKNKVMSVIMMGFVFSLTSFTCTVPIVSNLSIAFSRGDWVTPLIGMTIFATVFALPFFLLALFPKAMKSLPKSGGWLNSVKVVMGFLEIAFALKFISNIDLVWKWDIFTRDLVLASWAATAIIIALYLLGRFNLPHDTPSAHIGPLRAVFAVVFLTGGIYLFTGFGGKHLGELDALLPPAEEQPFLAGGVGSLPNSAGGETRAQQEYQQWHPRLSSALAEAKASGKNVFVDFTGYTCTNCRAMESQVFSRREVKGIFEDFVLARLYTDDGSPLNDSNQVIQENRFNTIALPYYVILSPNDEPLGTFPGYTRNVESFISFLMQNRNSATKEVAEVQ